MVKYPPNYKTDKSVVPHTQTLSQLNGKHQPIHHTYCEIPQTGNDAASVVVSWRKVYNLPHDVAEETEIYQRVFPIWKLQVSENDIFQLLNNMKLVRITKRYTIQTRFTQYTQSWRHFFFFGYQPCLFSCW